jgi:hypothetical protein
MKEDKQTKQTNKQTKEKEKIMSNANRFSVDIEEMNEERVLIPAGTFPMTVSKAELKTGTPGSNPDGIWYALNLVLDIKDSSVAELTGQESPKAFFSSFVSIDKDSEKIVTNNPEFGALLKACGLKNAEANSIFTEAGSDASTQREFNKLYLEKVASVMVGIDVLGEVVHAPKEKGSKDLVARVKKLAAA